MRTDAILIPQTASMLYKFNLSFIVVIYLETRDWRVVEWCPVFILIHFMVNLTRLAKNYVTGLMHDCGTNWYEMEISGDKDLDTFQESCCLYAYIYIIRNYSQTMKLVLWNREEIKFSLLKQGSRWTNKNISFPGSNQVLSLTINFIIIGIFSISFGLLF